MFIFQYSGPLDVKDVTFDSDPEKLKQEMAPYQGKGGIANAENLLKKLKGLQEDAGKRMWMHPELDNAITYLSAYVDAEKAGKQDSDKVKFGISKSSPNDPKKMVSGTVEESVASLLSTAVTSIRNYKKDVNENGSSLARIRQYTLEEKKNMTVLWGVNNMFDENGDFRRLWWTAGVVSTDPFQSDPFIWLAEQFPGMGTATRGLKLNFESSYGMEITPTEIGELATSALFDLTAIASAGTFGKLGKGLAWVFRIEDGSVGKWSIAALVNGKWVTGEKEVVAALEDAVNDAKYIKGVEGVAGTENVETGLQDILKGVDEKGSFIITITQQPRIYKGSFIITSTQQPGIYKILKEDGTTVISETEARIELTSDAKKVLKTKGKLFMDTKGNMLDPISLKPVEDVSKIEKVRNFVSTLDKLVDSWKPTPFEKDAFAFSNKAFTDATTELKNMVKPMASNTWYGKVGEWTRTIILGPTLALTDYIPKVATFSLGSGLKGGVPYVLRQGGARGLSLALYVPYNSGMTLSRAFPQSLGGALLRDFTWPKAPSEEKDADPFTGYVRLQVDQKWWDRHAGSIEKGSLGLSRMVEFVNSLNAEGRKTAFSFIIKKSPSLRSAGSDDEDAVRAVLQYYSGSRDANGKAIDFEHDKDGAYTVLEQAMGIISLGRGNQGSDDTKQNSEPGQKAKDLWDAIGGIGNPGLKKRIQDAINVDAKKLNITPEQCINKLINDRLIQFENDNMQKNIQAIENYYHIEASVAPKKKQMTA